VLIRPERGDAHLLLAQSLRKSGAAREALASCRRAVELLPRGHAEGLQTLGGLLLDQGFLREALETERSAVRAAGDHGLSWYGLGLALQACGILEEAERAQRRSLELVPGRAETHCNLGLTLGLMGRFDEALAEVRTGHEIGSRRKRWAHPSERWLQELETFRSLVAPLQEVEHGEREPAGAKERVALAEAALRVRSVRTAAKLFTEAFATEPSLLQAHFASAVRSAARASVVSAAEGGDPAGQEQARWSRQTRDWLESALSAASAALEQGATGVEPAAARLLWETMLVSPDLARLREPESLASLSDAERAEWTGLWERVRGFLRALQDR
jgi:tetratricopeptide (TPR) repeat protein